MTSSEFDIGDAPQAGACGVDVDELYDAFCEQLPTDLEGIARSLMVRLGLAPSQNVPWSRVFKHDVTLAAPVLFAEGAPALGRVLLRRATLAHLLTVIEAFGNDRIADGQIADAPELRRLFTRMRLDRDRALASIGGDDALAAIRRAEENTQRAIARERETFAAGERVTMEVYEGISAAKQAVGLIASTLLAEQAGRTARDIALVETTLLEIALGLQFLDDVVDWEDDLLHGGAWIVLLAQRSDCGETTRDPLELRRSVERSGVQAEVLALAERSFRRAAAGAASIGATRLSAWAAEHADHAAEQRDGERRSPGYARRSRALRSFRMEVLS